MRRASASIARRASRSPLGSAAGYGTPGLPLDRELTRAKLGFDSVHSPVTAVQLARGKAEAQLLFECTLLMQDLGRLAADLLLFYTQEFAFVTLPASFTTGSSIMPQKRNPDVFELVRGRSAVAQACLSEVLGIFAKLPSGYQRDLQLIKPPLFRGIDLALATAGIMADRHRWRAFPCRPDHTRPRDSRRRGSECAGRARRHPVPRGISPHRREIPQVTSPGVTMAIWFGNPTIDDARASHVGLLASHLGIEFTEWGDDFLRGTMPVEPRTRQPMGYLHGGASLVLAETLGSVAANFVVDYAKFRCLGQEINANHLRPVTDGLVIGTARPFHLGSRSQVWSIEIRDPRERLVCISRLTVAVVEWRPQMNQHPLTGYTHVMYALHALAGFIGVTSGATDRRRLRVRAAVHHRHPHELRAPRCGARLAGSKPISSGRRARSGPRWCSASRCSASRWC